MFHKKYFKKRILLARLLKELYSREGEKKRSLTYVWKTYGADMLCMGFDSFSKYCRDADTLYPGEEPPLYVEAAMRALKRYREAGEGYESGVIPLWQIPHTGEYMDLIETIRDHKRKKLLAQEKAGMEGSEAGEREAEESESETGEAQARESERREAEESEPVDRETVGQD